MTQLSRHRYFFLLLMLSILLNAVGNPMAAHAAGSVSLTYGSVYTENFDTLAGSSVSNVLPNGWYFSEAGGDTTYAAGTGSDNAGNTYSFGAAGNAERAFGELTSNSLASTLGANFVNTTGAAILSLTVGYSGEQWRRGSAILGDRLDFQYSLDATSLTTGVWTDVNALDFASPITSGANDPLNGNASQNRTTLGFTIGGLNIPNGASFWIRWTPLNASGNDDGLAVDDFSLAATVDNIAPTDIALTNAAVVENLPLNNTVGTFSTTDPDAGNTFTYSLVNGTGDTGNASFNISGTELRTSAVFDFETQTSYSVRIRSTDQGGLFFEKVFTVNVTDVNDVFTDTTAGHFASGTLGSCATDNTVGNGALKLNIPGSATCQFTSRIFDAGVPVDWTNLAVTTTLPVGTGVTFDARTGNSASPDITWTNWQVVNGGTFTNPGSRYIQYRAALNTTDTGQTPVVEEVTINYVAGTLASLTSPDGALTSWNGSFSWTGVNGATWYLLEVYTNGGSQMLRKWYTSAQTSCAVGTACTLTPASTELNLGNGSYQWRVLDYGAYGYGVWPLFKSFSLSSACYTLTTNVTPASSGMVNVPSQNCGGGYTAGTVVQMSVMPGTGYAFLGWSGDAVGTSNQMSIVMDGNKSVTANLRGNTPLTPTGTVTNWTNTFSWTGLSDATWYLIELQTSGGAQVFRQWYTSTQTGCAGGTNCSVTAALNLANGEYKWRVLDYGAYGYGLNSAFKTFTLNGTVCYTLTTNISPALSGSVTVPAQTCLGGYTPGSVIQLTAVSNNGYLFTGWSGDAGGTSNPVSITMYGNKTVTANYKVIVGLNAPSGTLTSWNNTFSWSGLNNATWYLLEVYTSGGTQVFRKWYTSVQSGCAGGANCSVAPSETAGLVAGTYKWRILDYGAYGYGIWTPYMNFTKP